MKILLLLGDGAKRAPVRYAVTLTCIALCFVLFGLLYNIKAGFDYTLEWLSGDSLRVMNKISLREPLPRAYLSKLEATPGVVGVQYASFFGGYYQDPKQPVSAAAIAPERLLLFPHLQIPAAQLEAMKRTRTGAVAGRALADRYGWKIGDKVTLISSNLTNRTTGEAWTFDLVGIWDMQGNPDLSNEIYVDYEYVNEGRVSGTDTVNIYIVRTASTGEAKSVARLIDGMFANSAAETWTRSDREWVGAAVRRIGDVHLMVNLVMGTALFTLFVLTRNAIAQSVRERTSDFGVLKVLGFRDGAVAGLVVFEALLLCMLGAIVGLLVSRLLGPWFSRQMQMTLLSVPPGVFRTGLMLACMLALIASVPLAVRIWFMTPARAVMRS